MKLFNALKNRTENRPSLKKKVYLSLGALAAMLLLSGVLSILEYRRVSEKALELGFDGYFQEASSAADVYIPPFAEGQKI